MKVHVLAAQGQREILLACGTGHGPPGDRFCLAAGGTHQPAGSFTTKFNDHHITLGLFGRFLKPVLRNCHFWL